MGVWTIEILFEVDQDRGMGDMSTEIVVAIATVISTIAAVGGIMLTVMFSFGKRFDRLDERFTRIDEKFDRVDERFDRVDEKFTRIDEKFDRLDERFTRIDEKFDRIDERFDRLQVQLDRRFAEVNENSRALGMRVDGTNSRLERLADSVYRITPEIVQTV